MQLSTKLAGLRTSGDEVGVGSGVDVDSGEGEFGTVFSVWFDWIAQ
jgi:hypothetical protein